MSEPVDHLDVHRARALAEDGGGSPADAAHARACPACARKVEQARGEEAALRAALPVEPPRDLLARTLASVRESRDVGPEVGRSSGGRPRRVRPRTAPGVPPAVIALGITLAVIVGAFVLARRPAQAPTPAPTPPPIVRPPAPPVAPPPVAPPPATPAPTDDEPEPEPEPEDLWSAPIPDEDGPAVEGPDVVVEAPPSDPTPPSTPTATETGTTTEVVKAFARVRAGALTAGGRALGAGSAVPAGAALRAGSAAVELEVDGGVLLALAPRAGLTLEEEAPGGAVVVRLERGRLFARTAGARPWALATPEGRAAPIGTALLAQREGARTRVATLDGVVRLTVAGSDDSVVELDLRPGFEAELARGRAPVARPLAAARALTWLPDALRPAAPATPVIVAVHEFEDGRGRWTKGDARPGGARGSRGSLRGVPGAEDYAVSVELEAQAGVVTLDPDLWLEATVRVDRRARVALQLWDHDRKENLALLAVVEPGRWTTLAAPLRAFTDPSGAPRTTPVARGDRGTCLTVFAGEDGETLELLVDDVRLWRQP